MQFDNTRIAIRERDFLDVLDLSLSVARTYAGPLAVALLVTAAPLAVLNGWLVYHWPTDPWSGRMEVDTSFWEWLLRAFRMFGLVVAEIPLAAAAMTRLLGHTLFLDRPRPGQIARELAQAAPQLAWYQIVLRGALVLPALLWPWSSFLALLWLIPYLAWPYLNEVILLERNPYRGAPGQITTWRRSRALHSAARGSLFGRWLASLLYGAMMIAGLTATLYYICDLFTRRIDAWPLILNICLPIATWIVFGFFTVVRYLSYLDLRIRGDGWEVELRLRAEAARLARQIA